MQQMSHYCGRLQASQRPIALWRRFVNIAVNLVVVPIWANQNGSINLVHLTFSAGEII